ncbi:MAG: 2-hydroxyacid dehydrogenase [Pirellulales bacterium]|nr:2-hydroxyacid dehydrogenase [Pirellulales bacterium]
MNVAVFSTKPYDRRFFDVANARHGHELTYLEARLSPESVALAAGFPAVCAFVNDRLDAQALAVLAAHGTRLVALRCAGFNNVDLAAAKTHGIAVARVPAYSPHAVAEHTVALLLTLNRRIHRAFNRVREGNFAIDGLLGYDLHGKTVGVLGTGRIGALVCRILHGFGCRVLAYDVHSNPECLVLGVEYVELPELLAAADVVTLHCPLTPQTHHVIDGAAIARMKLGVTIVNTSRGPLVDSQAVIAGLKSGKIGALALDVYEEEEDVFFEDLSDKVLQDDILARLLTFSNVLITSHQAFFTREAMEKIAETTLANVSGFAAGRIEPANLVRAP